MTYQSWRRWTEWPLLGVSVLFIAAYTWEVVGDLRGRAEVPTEEIQWAIWALFVIDYIVSLALVHDRRNWFFRHIPDLLVVALPVLRPLRLLRVLRLLAVFHRRTAAAFRERVMVYVIVSAALLVYVGALAELDAERGDPHATIRSFGDSVWWAFVTITTVGYGDYFPVTIEGRLVAAVLMLAGVALIGVVTATLATWFIDQVRRLGRLEPEDVVAEILEEDADDAEAADSASREAED